MTSEPTDESLMARFCDGDSSAFDVLFTRHARPLHRFVLRMVRDPALAEDVSQAAFLSLVRARGRYVRGSSVSAWLHAIAANAARDALRSRSRSPEALTKEGAVPDTLATEPAFRDANLEQAIQSALAQLPVAQREAVVMHRFQGLSFAEIADAVGASVGAVKVRAHRGYERLRELLRGLEPTP